MIYLCSTQTNIPMEDIVSIDPKKAVDIISTWDVIQFDTETDSLDCHIGNLLTAQFGNKDKSIQVVVDCTTVDIKLFKGVLESKLLIGHNLKFDLQWLYNYGIVPRNVYDTMIVEQFLHLGYPHIKLSPEEYNIRHCDYPYLEEETKEGKIVYSLSYSLKAVAMKRLKVYIDKTVRGEIIWRGLDINVIKYAAGDVLYLDDLMWSQVKDLNAIPNAIKGAKIECDFTPVVAYLEWCGIKLDVDKWKLKMSKDREHLKESEKALNDFILRTPALNKVFTFVDNQGDLFSGFNLEPQININWSSSDQVIKVAKILGFNTTVQDKETGEDKESAMEKHLISQKGINDEFLKLYFGKGEEGDDDYFPGYSGSFKVCSSFGQGHINAINPNTGRIHTIYRAIGTISGRMSSGSNQTNEALAKLKGLPVKPSSKQKKEGKGCTYPNMQQLPHDELTRACFVAEEGNLFCSCDYSARLNYSH